MSDYLKTIKEKYPTYKIKALRKYISLRHTVLGALKKDYKRASNKPTVWWPDKYPKMTRWILAGPVAFIVSLLSMSTLPVILPASSGSVDHLVFPVIVFPLIWIGFLIYPVMTNRLTRASLVFLSLLVIEIALIMNAVS